MQVFLCLFDINSETLSEVVSLAHQSCVYWARDLGRRAKPSAEPGQPAVMNTKHVIISQDSDQYRYCGDGDP